MIKSYLSFAFLLVCFMGLAQKDFVKVSEIRKQSIDSTSNFFHERLVYRFNFNPTSLSPEEMKYLYYGKRAKNGDKGTYDFVEYVKANQHLQAIDEGEKILSVDPANLEVLGLILMSYSKSEGQKFEEKYALRGMQFQRVLKTIIENGSDEEKLKRFTVAAIADQYILANVMGIDLRLYRRSSGSTKDGIIDYWKFGNKKLEFLVNYDMHKD